MGGVIFLYASGSWPLALIVLVASVMIPLGKLVALAYLLITVQRGSVANMHDRTRIYTWSSSSAAGRCSMCSSTRSSSRWCNCSR